MFSKTNWFRALSLSLLSADFVRSVELGLNAQDMFNESMTFLDDIYDPSVGYLRYFYYPLAASAHETRSSVWYSVGLLQRNNGSDVDEAVKIIENVIGGQEKNTSLQWYGDYTVYPEQPTVGSGPYAPKIYNSWDPNWRGFIGTALIIIYEEYGCLLPGNVRDLILESVKNSTIGDTYRVNNVDGDNLSPSYSNPWLMRTMASSWTGLKLKDSNMTTWGDQWAEEFLELFDRNHTLSEFNSPTYAGVSLYALTLAAKYLGTTDSVIGTNAARVIQEIWENESALWNPNLRNFAGPWDRTYGLDMNNYVAIMSLWIWSFVGKESVYKNTSPIWTFPHADDFEFAPVAAVLSDFHRNLVSNSSISALTCFTGEHTYNGNVYAPPADKEQRNITSWLSENITIGAQSFNQDGAGGYRKDIAAWSPAVVQWLRPDESVGYFSLYTVEKAMQVDVGPYSLNLSYPLGTSSSNFTFHLPTNPLGEARDITGLEDIYGLDVEVIGGTVSAIPSIAFCGFVGGDCDVIHDFEFWSLTFSLPKNSSEIPSIHLKFSQN